jgi:uncharacterized membrane protein
MFYSRTDTGTAIGGGMLGTGTVAEIAKKGADPAKDLMQLDVLCGMVPGYYLNLGGLIAIIGVLILVHSAVRGWKEKKRRTERDNIIAFVITIAAVFGYDLAIDAEAQSTIVAGVMAVVNIVLRLDTTAKITK